MSYDEEPYPFDMDSEYEKDYVLAADELFNEIYSTSKPVAIGVGSPTGLVAKLENAYMGEFSISDYSLYRDSRWVLLKRKASKNLVINFNSKVLGFNSLKKVIAYHLIPDFHPFGRIRSYTSTETYVNALTYLEKFIFSNNGIDASKEGIRCISTRMVNEALDKARNDGAQRNYVFLFFVINFWLSLSIQKLIPFEFRLNVDARRVDTINRRKDIQERIRQERIGWKPYGEEDLFLLLEYAMSWVEKGLPNLRQLSDYLDSIGAMERSNTPVNKNVKDEILEGFIDLKVGDVRLCNISRNERVSKVKNKYGKTLSYNTVKYFWLRPFKKSIDHVRNGIFILLALITGMRNKELAHLKFEDIKNVGEDKWAISISRFKTSNDPNYFGEADEIPLPKFIANTILEYKKLRDLRDLLKKGYLLETVDNRDTTQLDRAILKVAKKVGEYTGVDSVHPHRFRKTIAELLIARSEKNIDLIRLLFGHKTYNMTLRYIARNPYLIESVTEALEENYTEGFVEIVNAIRSGKGYSGKPAERIAEFSRARPSLFKGKLMRISVQNYITHLLKAGEPIVIQRTSIGSYCVSSKHYSSKHRPICLNQTLELDSYKPDTGNCQLECDSCVVLDDARTALTDNIVFYENLLKENSFINKDKVHKSLISKIKINQRHLDNLDKNRSTKISDNPLLDTGD